MKRITVLLAFALLAVSARAAIFVTTLQPVLPSKGGGGAFLTVNLQTRGWGLSGAISNLVFSASSVGVFGPSLPGQAQPVPTWLPLVHDVDREKNTILTGGGVFTEEELDRLQQGLFQIRVHTDRNQFPEGELSGPLVAVPEPGSAALVAGLGLCAYAGYRRRMLTATSSSNGGLLTDVKPSAARTDASRLSTLPVRGFSHSTA